jgi:hypothetical protein
LQFPARFCRGISSGVKRQEMRGLKKRSYPPDAATDNKRHGQGKTALTQRMK